MNRRRVEIQNRAVDPCIAVIDDKGNLIFSFNFLPYEEVGIRGRGSINYLEAAVFFPNCVNLL